MEWADPSPDYAVDQLRACANDAPLRNRIANAGAARVRAQLSMRVVGERMRSLLQ